MKGRKNMCYVEVRQSSDDSPKKHKENVENALKEFKRRIKKDGILYELKLRESYMSPSKKKRFRHAEAMKRRRRDERKQQWVSKKPMEQER